MFLSIVLPHLLFWGSMSYNIEYCLNWSLRLCSFSSENFFYMDHF